MAGTLKLLVEAQGATIEDIIPTLASVRKDIKDYRLTTNVSGVGKAGYVFRIIDSATTPKELDGRIFLSNALRAIAGAKSLEEAQLLASSALALTTND